MKRKLHIICLLVLALLAFAVGANAERYVTNGSYTAYIGENDYTYLEDPTGVTKVLQTATKELLSMTDTHLYCLTMDGSTILIWRLPPPVWSLLRQRRKPLIL